MLGASKSRDEVAEADVCIVGAGAVGIAIAKELAGTAIRVVVLESGGATPDAAERTAYKVLPGETIRLGTDDEKPSYLGGNTNYWYGNCRPLEKEDFEPRDWLPHSGWPIGLDELIPYYRRAQRLAGLGDFLWYDVQATEPLLHHGPLDVSPSILETRIVQTTPVFSFADLYGQQLEATDNVQVFLRTQVVRLEASIENDRVVAVEAVGPDGHTLSIKAGTFILASGGVENARLLLRSSETALNSLGNDNDLVGRFFMEHFYFVFSPEVVGIASSRYRQDDLRIYAAESGERESAQKKRQRVGDASVWGQLASSSELMRREQVPGLTLWFRPDQRIPRSLDILRRLLSDLGHRVLPRRPLTDLREVILNPARSVRFLLWKLTGRGRPSRDYELIVQLEQAPDPENRIRLSESVDRFGQPNAVLSLRIDDEQLRAHAQALEIVADELGFNGEALARELVAKYAVGDFDFFWHHMGSTRMNEDPKQGVVNADCRVHGVSNLFVAGSSVFPTSGTAAPTLTAIALALRLADHIRANSEPGALHAPSSFRQSLSRHRRSE